MILDDKIDVVLAKLNGSPWCPLTEIPAWFKDPDKVDDREVEIIIHTLLKEELAFEKDGKFHITRQGTRIKESGWKNRVDEEDLEEKRKNEKTEYDLKNSKYLVKVRWWPIIISVIGLIISVRACIRAENSDSSETIKTEQGQQSTQKNELKGTDSSKAKAQQPVDSAKH